MLFTPRLNLPYPAEDDELWDGPLAALFQAIDSSFLGSLAVVPAENPSSTPRVIVRGGTYVDASGAMHSIADFAPQAIPASSTKSLYLNASGDLVVGAAWPAAGAGKFVPLAIVTTGTSAITNIVDMRHPCGMAGS